MRLHRLLVPLAAGVVVLGVFVAVAIALSQKHGVGGAASAGWTELGELVSIKNEAESMAIEGKLPEAHAKYRELFARAQGHDIKDPAYWDLMERAKMDQDRIYMILLAQQDPARVLTPPLPGRWGTAPLIGWGAQFMDWDDDGHFDIVQNFTPCGIGHVAGTLTPVAPGATLMLYW